ncbi:MAG TPA: glucose-1-phosphate cytidylyltransferase [Myxococcota bacterium]|nr:glucose-1-phosphate cytidylyltransferase [Myxococcota bacterium]
MKVVVLAGGLGTRLAEETETRPKPMVEIGGRPILWHILKHYAEHGFREFYVALGYKGEQIKRFFLEYRSMSSSMTVSLRDGRVEVHDDSTCDDWTVHLIDTGIETNTGGRLKRLEPFLSDGTFMLTYGDGLSDVDLRRLHQFHGRHGRLATVTAVRPPARFGGLVFDGDRIAEFTEKPQIGEGWVNGGFMVLEPGIFPYLEGDGSSLEADGLEAIARDGQLMAYRHEQFWQCMDTVRELRALQRLWSEGRAPWKIWK